jgi:hypothetical protein
MKSIILNFKFFKFGDFFPFYHEPITLASRLGVDESLIDVKDARRARIFNIILKVTHILFIPSLLGLLYGSMFEYVGEYKVIGYSLLVAMGLMYLLFVFIFFSMKYHSIIGEFQRVRNPNLSITTYSLLTAFLGRYFPFVGIVINLYLLNKATTTTQRKVIVVMLLISSIWTLNLFYRITT